MIKPKQALRKRKAHTTTFLALDRKKKKKNRCWMHKNFSLKFKPRIDHGFLGAL